MVETKPKQEPNVWFWTKRDCCDCGREMKYRVCVGVGVKRRDYVRCALCTAKLWERRQEGREEWVT